MGLRNIVFCAIFVLGCSVGTSTHRGVDSAGKTDIQSLDMGPIPADGRVPVDGKVPVDGVAIRDADVEDAQGASDGELCAENRNDQIRLALAPQCASCHGTGTNQPFFASLRAFEDLLVYNPTYVDRDNPEEGLLLKLLQGRGTGTYTQMPLGEASFMTLAERGETEITMDEIRAWLSNLAPQTSRRGPDRSAPTTRRLKAEEIKRALLAQLGLDEERDFIARVSPRYAYSTVELKGPLPLYSEDRAPILSRSRDKTAAERMANLGAPGWLSGRKRSNELTPSFLQTLVQVSQAWCALAVGKGEGGVLFREVSPDATSEMSADDIRRNLHYLYLRFIGDRANENEIDALYGDVFLHYEAHHGSSTAWQAVCAALIRHPRWLSY